MNQIKRYDPLAELSALQRQFFGDDIFAPFKAANIPTTDVYTRDNTLVVEAHLPNFSDKDVDIRVENGNLVIQAQRHEVEEDKDKKYVVRESSNSFYRQITLPERADENAIEARLDDGILRVNVLLTPLPEPKKIAIESGKKK